MRVLLDENLPADLAAELVGHEARSVAAMGWQGVKNGELLRRTAGVFDVLLTMDRNLPHQQNVAALSFGVVVVGARSNRMGDLVPLLPTILAAITRIRAGELRFAGTS